MSIEQISLLIISALTLGLAAAVIWLILKFRALTHGVKKGNLIKLLDKVLQKEKKNEKDIRLLEKKLSNLTDEVAFHVQKFGLVRFNPFEEMGGDHSFSLALLDGKDSGFILTGLHTRERTRVYIKRVKKGKSEHDLSKEEKKALDKARKGK